MDLMLPETIEMFSVPLSGHVKEPISANRPGRVAAIASTWTARFYNPHCQVEVSPGEPVTIVGRHGIMLLVIPPGHSLPPLPKPSGTFEEFGTHLTQAVSTSSQTWRSMAGSFLKRLLALEEASNNEAK